MNDYFFDGVDEAAIRREKDKARRLRNTNWWRSKLSSGQCYYCQHHFLVKELTMDHVNPLARGGLSTKGNIVVACKTCNSKKRSLLPLEWEEYMDSLER